MWCEEANNNISKTKHNSAVQTMWHSILYVFFKLLYIWRQPGIGVQIMTNENDMNKLHFEDAWSRLQIRKNIRDGGSTAF